MGDQLLSWAWRLHILLLAPGCRERLISVHFIAGPHTAVCGVCQRAVHCCRCGMEMNQCQGCSSEADSAHLQLLLSESAERIPARTTDASVVARPRCRGVNVSTLTLPLTYCESQRNLRQSEIPLPDLAKPTILVVP
ncbi:unnamed protein product, partial [Pleuronectes platessa]